MTHVNVSRLSEENHVGFADCTEHIGFVNTVKTKHAYVVQILVQDAGAVKDEIFARPSTQTRG